MIPVLGKKMPRIYIVLGNGVKHDYFFIHEEEEEEITIARYTV